MKKIIVILLLLICIKASSQNEPVPPFAINNNNATFETVSDSLLRIFYDNRIIAVKTNQRSVGKADSVNGGYYPWSNPLGFLVNPTTLPANFLTYYTGTAFANSVAKYSTGGLGRLGYGYGSSTPIDNGIAVDSGYNWFAYNSLDHTTNKQEASIAWSSNTYRINLTTAGTGTIPSFLVQSNSRGYNLFGNAASITGIHNFFTGSFATSGRAIMGISGSTLAQSGTNTFGYGLNVMPQISQGSSSGYSAIAAIVFENTTGSGPHRLFDGSTSSAVDGGGTITNQWGVFSDGHTTQLGSATMAIATGTTGDSLVTTHNGLLGRAVISSITAWTRVTNYVYPNNTTDSVGIGNTSPTRRLDNSGKTRLRDSVFMDAAVTVTGIQTSSSIDNYAANYGASYTARTKTDKGYVDSSITANISTTTSGTYTPSFTNTLNITSSTVVSGTYLRIGNIVHVSIAGNITPTLPASSTKLTFTLPFTTSTTSQLYVGQMSADVNGGASFTNGVSYIDSGTTGSFTYLPASTGTTLFNVSFVYKLN